MSSTGEVRSAALAAADTAEMTGETQNSAFNALLTTTEVVLDACRLIGDALLRVEVAAKGCQEAGNLQVSAAGMCDRNAAAVGHILDTTNDNAMRGVQQRLGAETRAMEGRAETLAAAYDHLNKFHGMIGVAQKALSDLLPHIVRMTDNDMLEAIGAQDNIKKQLEGWAARR